MNTSSQGTALITGASSGIGAIYADRLARRGHDLILVARNRGRLEALATRVAAVTGRRVAMIVADLNNKADLARVEQVLRDDDSITALVNNAGVGAPAAWLDADIDKMAQMIDLNITALVRLTYAVAPAFVKRGNGAIINIGSVVGIAPELLNGVYGGTKAFVLAFTLSLQKEFAESNIRVQAVLPGATATDFWDIAGTPLEQVPSELVMKVDDMVDAAIAGFDQRELITIPSLPDIGRMPDTAPRADRAQLEKQWPQRKPPSRLVCETVGERAALLGKLAEALEAEQDNFARLLTEEQGRRLPDSLFEITFLVAALRYFAALDLPVEVLKEEATQKVVRLHKTLGVVTAITAWNV